MSSKRQTKNGVINVKAFEKLLTPSEEIPESETDLDTSALNSTPQNDQMEEEVNIQNGSYHIYHHVLRCTVLHWPRTVG